MYGPETKCLAVTVDIEDWYHIPSVCGSPFSVYRSTDEFFNKWTSRYDYLSEPTKRVLNLLTKFDIKATFFVVADVAEKYPGLVESIADQGHVIACHGLHHSCKIDPQTKQPLISQKTFEENTILAKNILEEATGQRVVGYRAPNALITGWMIDSLEDIGFRYDSSVSVNSLYNKTDSSLKGVGSSPYYPKCENLEPSIEKRNICEFPFAYWKFGFKIPTSGGPMLRFLGKKVMLKGLKQSLQRGPTVLYFHSIDVGNDRFPAIGNKRPFYWLIKGDIVQRRVEFILERLKDVQKLTLREIVSTHGV
jgi:hypothetical protein